MFSLHRLSSASRALLATCLFLVLLPAVLAQETSNPFPACATRCIGSAFQEGLCAPTNQTCICTNQQFQGTVALCVQQNCTIPESLATRNASLTNCGAPVRDRSGKYVVLSNTMAIIAAIFVVLRFGLKLFIAPSPLGLDDWFDIWTLDGHMITAVGRYFYIMASLYFTQLTLLKLSIIFFYTRIFPAREVQRLLWGTAIFTICYGVAFVITAIFQCQPIHYFWTKWDGMHEGKCHNANTISWTNAAISIALDLWMLAIPLWQLRSLKLHWKKKVGVAMMFCVGTFVTVVSILRLQSLVHFASTSNTTWEFYDVSVWSTIEITVGIMCACMPAVRLLLVRFFPALAGSSARSRGAMYYEYGSGPRSKTTGTRNGTRTGTTSYDVQYSDNDEASLVHMSDLPPVAKRP
ncbi:Peptidyl-prolyl cis-trans isomerase-like 4 [Verticillium dahliae VDG1]|nr:Peptidyl-prolyl cis-trans isomerase-like 4 [Verticillium dahliae VDG1]